MDGTVRLCSLEDDVVEPPRILGTFKHGKYVKNLTWSPSAPLLASASADGTVMLHKVETENDFELKVVEKLHLDGAVEALCFLDNGDTLCCYNRGTSYLSYFHLNDGCKHIKHSLNDNVTTGGFDDHVSFAVMSLAPSPDGGRYLAASTDASRNIVLRTNSSQQVRNLYGHKNDGFSQPVVAWSANGQYLYGNTQDDNCVCVWDCASSSIVRRLEGHTGQLRHLYSSPLSDTLVTVSFDRTARIRTRGFS